MKNRWLIALSAVGVHICIGSVYAWSVLTKPIMRDMGFSLGETTWAFSIAILFLGLSAAFLGPVVEQMGPRRSGFLSALFFGSGLLGTGMALWMHSLPLLYLFYGVIGGIGLGVGYITPVSTLVKWFPDHRGFATGLAIMGFGFAGLLAGPVMQALTDRYGLIMNFLILGIFYSAVISVSAWYLAPPRPGDVHPALRTVPEGDREKTVSCSMEGPQLTRRQALHTWQFYTLWWIFFTNITCGIGLLAVASPMAQEMTGMTAAGAASMVGLIGLMNGFGRIGWSTVSDWMGRPNTYLLFFFMEILAFGGLASTDSSWVFMWLTCLIITCYGGGFACMPAYLADLFGVRQLASIHGCILTAWGMAGIAGPLLLAFLKDSTGSYSMTLQIFAGLLLVSFLAAAGLKRYGKAEGIFGMQEEKA